MCKRSRHQAVGADGNGEILDVVGHDELPTVHHSRCLGGLHQRQRAARGKPYRQLLATSRRLGDVQNILNNRFIHSHRQNAVLKRDQLIGGHHRLEPPQASAGRLKLEYLPLGVPVRIAHSHPQHEPVKLILRQEVRPLEVKRVLRSQHHERRAERICLAVVTHLGLVHRLQQGALRPRCCAVDLVDQDDIREDRPALEDELILPGIPYAHPEYVAGQQIRRQLDPVEYAVDAAGDRVGQDGLADARHVLQQHVPTRQQRHQHAADYIRLAEQDRFDILAQFIKFSVKFHFFHHTLHRVMFDAITATLLYNVASP